VLVSGGLTVEGGPRGGRPAGRATAQRGHCRLFGWTPSVATPRVRRLRPREQVVVVVSELICRHTHHTNSLTPHAILPTSKLRSSTTYPSLLSAHLLQPILYCYLLICRNTVGWWPPENWEKLPHEARGWRSQGSNPRPQERDVNER